MLHFLTLVCCCCCVLATLDRPGMGNGIPEQCVASAKSIGLSEPAKVKTSTNVNMFTLYSYFILDCGGFGPYSKELWRLWPRTDYDVFADTTDIVENLLEIRLKVFKVVCAEKAVTYEILSGMLKGLMAVHMVVFGAQVNKEWDFSVAGLKKICKCTFGLRGYVGFRSYNNRRCSEQVLCKCIYK
mmetsp:Transcript_10100/g.21992  ORF Transcript_10100/g.21992 Transcript_10100/m.21992 type:complete len:185 (-) Transcript_10100:233-787(-)